jgi:hypothetical protein
LITPIPERAGAAARAAKIDGVGDRRGLGPRAGGDDARTQLIELARAPGRRSKLLDRHQAAGLRAAVDALLAARSRGRRGNVAFNQPGHVSIMQRHSAASMEPSSINASTRTPSRHAGR